MRSTHRLRRHVAHHDAVGGAAEAAVRHQRHVLPQAGTHQGGAGAQHLRKVEDLGSEKWHISRKKNCKFGACLRGFYPVKLEISAGKIGQVWRSFGAEKMLI